MTRIQACVVYSFPSSEMMNESHHNQAKNKYNQKGGEIYKKEGRG